MKIILACIFISIIIFSSCKQTSTVYYNDTNNYDDGDIWGSDLQLFFKKDLDIKIVINEIASKKIIKELDRIKQELVTSGNSIKWDDNFYNYAFILNEKDTLYLNAYQQVWRFEKHRLRLESSIDKILKERKYSTSQTN